MKLKLGGIIMKKLFTLTISILLFGSILIAQEWQQTGGTPEGGGVTEIVVLPNNDMFVTTGSFNWPTVNGGIRRSTDDGDTWENVFDAFNGRTITAGVDGNLYASVWPFPADEGLYRSTDNGDTWDLLVTVPTGNNIFSITVSTATNPVTIFAGTRNGVLRSTDNGATWSFSSVGIPAGSWVRDIEVDLSGVVAAATTNGLFISTDNGEQWEEATGDGIENETITKIVFEYPTDNLLEETRLLAGTATGKLFRTIVSSFLIVTLVALLSPDEVSGLLAITFLTILHNMLIVAQYSTSSQPDGVSTSTNDGVTWQQYNGGLPSIAPLLSALAGIYLTNFIHLRLGFYEDTANGAKVYKSTVTEDDFPTGIEDSGLKPLTGFTLYQNFPNPFEYNTLINYVLGNTGQVNLSVFASDGQLVSKLVDSRQSRGEHQFSFNAEGLTEGIYYYKLETDGLSEVRKMVVLR